MLFSYRNSNLWYFIWHSDCSRMASFLHIVGRKKWSNAFNTKSDKKCVGCPTHFWFIQHVFFLFFKFCFRSNVSNISPNTKNYRCWMKYWTRSTYALVIRLLYCLYSNSLGFVLNNYRINISRLCTLFVKVPNTDNRARVYWNEIESRWWLWTWGKLHMPSYPK